MGARKLTYNTLYCIRSYKEVSGGRNSYTTQFRQYDPRLGRWKSLDPLAGKFPSMSPFVAFNNNPIVYTDPLGLEGGTSESGGKPKENGGDEFEVVENESGIWVWNPETQSWTKSTNDVDVTAGQSSSDTGVKPIPPDVDNTRIPMYKYPYTNDSNQSDNSNTLADLGNFLDSWFRSLMGNAEASIGVEFVSKDNRKTPNALPPMRLTVDGWSIEIDIDDLEDLVDIISLNFPAVPKPKIIKPKYSRAAYRNRMYQYYDKNKMYRGLGKGTMAAKRKAADAAYDNYLKKIANQNKANIEKYMRDLTDAVKDDLSPIPDETDLARMYRDNTTAFGTASGGYGKTGAQSPAIVIQHSSGSYKYVNGEWWHRIILYKDSMYVPVTNSNNIPIEVLNQISK